MHPPVASFIAGTKGMCACLAAFSGRGGAGLGRGFRWGWGARAFWDLICWNRRLESRVWLGGAWRRLYSPWFISSKVRLSADREAAVNSCRCGFRYSALEIIDSRSDRDRSRSEIYSPPVGCLLFQHHTKCPSSAKWCCSSVSLQFERCSLAIRDTCHSCTILLCGSYTDAVIECSTRTREISADSTTPLPVLYPYIRQL